MGTVYEREDEEGVTKGRMYGVRSVQESECVESEEHRGPEASIERI